MNEVKHAWSALKSSSKTSSLNWRNSESDNASTTTWYDAPAPIIIHCREFRNEESAEKDQQEDNKKKKNKKKKSEEFAEEKEKQETDVEEALYENNAEILATSECSNNKIQRRVKRSDASSNLRVEQSKCSARRHSSTVELTATTSVKTNEDGLPTIRFSFLPYKERSQKNVDAAASEESFDENGEAIRDQLYDIPKCPLEQDKEVAIVAESDLKMMVQSQKKNSESSESEEFNEYEAASHLTNELYDIPKSLSDKCVNESSRNLSVKKEDSGESKLAAILLFKSKRDRLDRTKRSTRSLKIGRKNYGTSESNVYERGVTSMSGSYSDSECPNDSSSNVSRGTSRLKLEKQRLGKAWGKMRTWLRDERTKIGEVVQRHARMQAVGALSGDEDATATAFNKIGKTVKSGSYDLTKAEAPRNAEEFGSVTRVEEFGLASVSEEANSCEVVVDASTDERPASNFSSSEKDLSRVRTNERHDDEFFVAANLKNLCKKTVSSDDILGCNESKKKFSAVSSVSMDKLCAKVESAANGDENTENETSSRERAGRGGMIKRRMLGSIRGLMASTHLLQASEIHEEAGQGGFEDVRRYVKQGGDFCKELASILHERAELEAMYAKGLSKLSNKLTKACAKDQGGNSTGGVNEAWRCVGEEMEAAAEAHRVWGIALGEQLAKPLRIGVAEAQGRSRKSIENSVDKASKSLQEWRGIAAKSKKHSFTCARENERLQDLARLQSISQSQQNNNKSSNHHMTEKEASKLESRRRKAEDSSRRADTEFYTVSVRAERARLEYESTVRKGAKQMELLEEERLSALKDLANVYLAHLQALAPRLQQSADRLSTPVRNCNVAQDVEILKNLIRRIESNDAVNAEQLLPDFYAEHITLAMNRERRKQALVRILHLIRQDLERERRGREGLETLHRAFIKTPAFAADESTQNVTEKLHHMRSMLFYLEAARYKVGGTLAEVEGSKRNKHPLAEHILVSRDKQGLQQSVLKIPSWGRNESFEIQDMDDELEVHLTKDHEPENRDWADRTAGDGNSENPPDEEDFSDFDEFSSHSEDNNNQDIDVSDVATTKSDRTEQCRAIYHYAANFHDELSLNPGDLITVHQKQADGWWIGECRGRTGIFPATYVQVIH